MKLTIEEAKKQGFTIDDFCYPHVGYKGSRFAPDEKVDVLTETETHLLEACHEIVLKHAHWNSCYKDISERPCEEAGCMCGLERVQQVIKEAKRD